jgi:hypothetical protein
MPTQGIDGQFFCAFELEQGRETVPLKGFEARAANPNRCSSLLVLDDGTFAKSSATKFT